MSRRGESDAGPDRVRGLMRPAAYPHPVGDIARVETHISWVFLTGEFAYKVKKPVALGFLDFSRLDLRKRYCEEELRVNRRTARELYLDVVPIGEDAQGLRVGAEPAVEYAVKMRQFPREARLDRCLGDGRLGRGDMRRLGETIARFHQSLPPRRSAGAAEEVERVLRPARKNFVHLDPAAFDDEGQQRLAVIEAWTLAQGDERAPAFARRADGGAVRECHGDLHLENLLLMDGRFVPFDAIEFNEELRWIDVANDIAFLVMDLAARREDGFAHAVLDAWLEHTGDYDSLGVMRYYLAYRSMVRAVVAGIRQGQRGRRAAAEDSVRPDSQRYVELAAELVDTPPPRLFLMHGFSGSGKTWLSERLVEGLPALRVRSDLERKRLAVAATQRETGRLDAGLYAPEVTQRVYDAVADACAAGLGAGFDMIADATFLRFAQRRRFVELAESLGARCVILDCHAATDVLRERVQRRAARRDDASDADLAVLDHQLADHDPLTPEERSYTLAVRSDDAPGDIRARLA